MNHKPLVSICMPVFNGQKYLRQTLDSFLAQDYEHFEVVILDNISTDDTRKICLSYTEKDSRIRYILDDHRVGDPEGHHRAACYAKGDFFLIACDDDIYAPSYISTLIKVMHVDENIGMAYTGFGYVYDDGLQVPVDMKTKYFLRADNSKLYNFCFYLAHRCPIPLQFGLMKTELHRQALKYFHRVDSTGGDHDNLYMLRLLSLSKVASIKDVLFYYRIKDRSYQLPKESEGWLKRYLSRARHQMLVSSTASRIIDNSLFSAPEKFMLKIYNFIVLLFNCSLKYLMENSVFCKILKHI